ncbi:MAG: hypothetical protein CR984_07630 [Proteobacteria bacterium]|nr:MAG: hypothetical protein CR984_07630 [Pseudomonadota bacterium]
MKTKVNIKRHWILLVGFIIFGAICTAHAAPYRVAILPFDMNAEKDLTFLQEGIMDMLGSRLAWPDKVEVINENETRAALMAADGFEGESRALLIGGKLQADYVLSGSLTVFGESVSIDANMLDVSGQQEPLPFFVQTRGMGEVIPQVNQFATNINATVFGRGVAVRSATTSVPAAQAQPAAPAHDPRMHPEKLLEGGVQNETRVPVVEQPNQSPNPAFKVATRTVVNGRNAPTFWKSRNFKMLITGLDIADVNNDGQLDVIVVSAKQAAVYTMANGRMVKSAEISKTRNSTFISADAADINGNGIPEIYVNRLGPNRTSVNSFVMEFDGSGYKTLTDGQNWFYRVVRPNARGALLLGQRQRMNDESIFFGAIQEMSWQGGRIVPVAQLLKGRKANALGVVYGDIMQTGQNLIAAYSNWDRLRIYNAASKMIWEDGERSGGNAISFKLPKTDPGQENSQFFPLRVRTVDIDRDGKTEILVARHEELAKSMLKNFRLFTKARIESMTWDGLGMVTQWSTQTFGGRASDFVVGDFDSDGKDELVIAVVTKEGAIIFTDSISNLIAFDLDG